MADGGRSEAARKKVEAKNAFYVHLSAYLAVNALLVIINLTTLSKEAVWPLAKYWCFWPAFGWGVGLAFHCLGAFTYAAKDRMIEKELRKAEERQGA